MRYYTICIFCDDVMNNLNFRRKAMNTRKRMNKKLWKKRHRNKEIGFKRIYPTVEDHEDGRFKMWFSPADNPLLLQSYNDACGKVAAVCREMGVKMWHESIGHFQNALQVWKVCLRSGQDLSLIIEDIHNNAAACMSASSPRR